MDRKVVLEKTVDGLWNLIERMEKHLIDRRDADSRVNAYGKVLKGVQLHIMDDVTRGKGGAQVIRAGEVYEQLTAPD